MSLKAEFLAKLAEAVAERVNTDEIERAVVEQIDVDGIKDAAIESLTGDIRTQDIEEAVVEALADDVNEDDIVDKVADLLVDKLGDDDDFIERVAALLAVRVMGHLTEAEPAVPINLSDGAVGCRKCGGSVFLHRNGTCPTVPAAR